MDVPGKEEGQMLVWLLRSIGSVAGGNREGLKSPYLAKP